MSQLAQIGDAARASGVSAKMIRYYEAQGLLPGAPRSAGNYRLYGAEEIAALRFIAHARELGFGLGDIASLLALRRDARRQSRAVKEIALAHAAQLTQRMERLAAMRDELLALAQACPGDGQPDCPILKDLGRP